MAFTQYYNPPMADVASAAYRTGAGQQQDLLNRQAIQQQQFGANLGLEQQALAERARQFDTSFGETQRQFDTSTDIQQQQFDAKQQLAQREVAQRGFLNLAGMWNQNQQLQTEIAAKERMAEFSRQANLESMGYQAGLEASSRIYQVDQQLQMQQRQQQQEQQAQLNHLNKLRAQGQISDMDFAAGEAQINSQIMGIKSQDPTMFMSPEFKEQYRQDMATAQARETQRLTLAETGKSQEYWNSVGMQYNINTKEFDDIPTVVHSMKLQSDLQKFEFDARLAAEKEAKADLKSFQDNLMKMRQETIPDGQGGTKLRYKDYSEAYNAAVEIFGNVTGANVPPPKPVVYSGPPAEHPWWYPTTGLGSTPPPAAQKQVVPTVDIPLIMPTQTLSGWRQQRAKLLAK